MSSIELPSDYDYVAVYLTDRCPLRCSYCITEHNDTRFITGTDSIERMKPDAWVKALNRLKLPPGVPITLQGGEPFVYHGIWELLEGVEQEIDILTAMPKNVLPGKWANLSARALKKLNRNAPYPNIRVSYHIGQNKLESIVPMVKELQSLVSIGIYAVDHPTVSDEVARAREYCAKHNVPFKTKEFLGFHEGKLYGNYLYPDAVVGKVTRPKVDCRNTVLILAPNGDAYRCHSDLYQKRKNLVIGNIADDDFHVDPKYRPCAFYGTCSECDIKVKNNHNQNFGYTSAQIRFPEVSRPAELSL